MTQTGTVLGTSDYIAPGAGAGPAGRRAHRRLLARRRPLRAAHRRAAVHRRQLRRGRDAAHQRRPAARAPKRPDVPPRVDAAVARALAKKPGRPLRDDGRLRPRARGLPRRASLAPRCAAPRSVIAPPSPRQRRASALRRAPRAPRVPAAGAPRRSSASRARRGGARDRDRATTTELGAGPVDGRRRRHARSRCTASARTTRRRATAQSTTRRRRKRDRRRTRPPTGRPSTTAPRSPRSASPGVGLVLDAGTPVTPHHADRDDATRPASRREIQAGDSAGGPFHDVSAARPSAVETTFDLARRAGALLRRLDHEPRLARLGARQRGHVRRSLCAARRPADSSRPSAAAAAPSLHFTLFAQTDLPLGQASLDRPRVALERGEPRPDRGRRRDGRERRSRSPRSTRAARRCAAPCPRTRSGRTASTATRPDNRIVRLTATARTDAARDGCRRARTPTARLAFDDVGRFGYALLVGDRRLGLDGGQLFAVRKDGRVQTIGAYPGPGGAENIAVAPAKFGSRRRLVPALDRPGLRARAACSRSTARGT